MAMDPHEVISSDPGPGGGLVVSVLAFYSYDLSLNPAGNLNFLYEKTKINENEAVVAPPLKNILTCVKVVLCLRRAGVGHETDVGWCSRADSCKSLIFLNALSARKRFDHGDSCYS